MAILKSCRLWLSLALLATMATGCNMLAMPFFLLPGMEPKDEPKCPLASKDKEREVKAVIIASTSSLETRPEFLRVDRELARMLTTQLDELFKNNKEKVKLVPVSLVEEYKNQHPNWRAQDLSEIGKHFKADYVIGLEIDTISIYEKGSTNMLFRGSCALSIDVINTHKESEGQKYHEEYTCEWPGAQGPIPAGDSNPAQFKQRFLTVVARQLSWRFSAHPTNDNYLCD